MEELLEDFVDFTLLLFEGLSQKIPRVHGIVNTFGLVFCGFGAHKMIYVFDETNGHKYFK